MLKKVGVKRWIYDEVRSQSAIEFKFSEKYPPSQYTSWLAQQMQENYPPQWTISGASLLRSFDPELINQHLSLLRPDNFRLTLASQEFPCGIKCDKIERWYNTEYQVLPISDNLLEVACCIPFLNVFIQNLQRPSGDRHWMRQRWTMHCIFRLQTNLSLSTSMSPSFLLRRNRLDQTWFKRRLCFVCGTSKMIHSGYLRPMFGFCLGIHWRMPHQEMQLSLRKFIYVPLISLNPYMSYSRLYIYLLEDSLTEYSYNAEVAGLSYHFVNDPDGIEVRSQKWHLCTSTFHLPKRIE